MDISKYFEILWLVLVSFVSSFSKNLNSYAKLPKRKRKFLVFISEVLLSGLCGSLAGIMSIYLYNNIYINTFLSGIGGILGVKTINIISRLLMAAKKIDIRIKDTEQNNNNNNKDK